MKIIAHRGFWKTESEKNTKVAIERAINNGFGFETDFRDCGGQILIRETQGQVPVSTTG